MDSLLSLVAKHYSETLENIYLMFETKVDDKRAREELKAIIDGFLVTTHLEAKMPVKENTCTHIMATGKRKGELCGKGNVPGGLFCKTHQPKKCHKCHRPLSRWSISGTSCRIHLKEELGDERSSYLRLDKYGLLVNQPTGLVFGDGEARGVPAKVVIGKDGGEGSLVVDLNDDDLECIKVYKFPVCERLVPYMRNYLSGVKRDTTEVPIVLVD